MYVNNVIHSMRHIIGFISKLIVPALILIFPLSSLGAEVNPTAVNLPAYASEHLPDFIDVPHPGGGYRSNVDLGEQIAYQDIPPSAQIESESTAIGFINYNGVPVEGATVAIIGPTATITMTTQPGPLSVDPYFTVTLSDPPLNALPNDVLKMGFSYSNQENISSLRVAAGEQELHGHLSSTCGPTDINESLISTNTIWTPECGPYRVHQNLMIESSFRLTVTAGTTVEFDPGRALLDNGFLFTNGTSNALVTFTSLNQTPGEWNYIQINTASILLGALVEYAGGADLEDSAAIRVDNGEAFFDNLIVRYSDSDGIQVYDDGDVQMNDMIISDNAGWGIVESSTSNNMYIYNSTVQFNGDGGIWIKITTVGKIYNNYIADNMGSGIYIQDSNLYVNIAGNIICRNQGSDGGGIEFFSSSGNIENNFIWDNHVTNRGGGIRVFSAAPEIRNNFILENSTIGSIYVGGGGLHLRPSSGLPPVNNNVIVGNTSVGLGGGIHDQAGNDVDISGNSILRNHADGMGGGIYADYPEYINTSIVTNTILENTAGVGQGAIQLTAKSDPIHLNNMYDNGDYTLFYGAPYDPANLLNAKFNWWGTDALGEIPALIWDWYDDSSLAEVNYSNPLTTSSINAPVTPPRNFVSVSEASTITLEWSPNLETDLAGYMLYIDTSDQLEIDTILGAVTPIDLGMTTAVTITDVPVGIYSMAVTAYDIQADGVKDWREGHESYFSQVETAIIGDSPQADFYGYPLNGTLPLEVNFTDTSTGDFDSWYWDFGDGGTSIDQHPTHIYTVSDTYTVTLTVNGPLGSDSEIKPAYINAFAEGTPPKASFSASPTSGIAPLIVNFTDTSIGAIDSWSWDFGDGATSTDQHPTHVYTVSDTYTVMLTVDGQYGSDTETNHGYITVNSAGGNPPVADFSANPTSGDAPLMVDFSDTSTGDVDSWYWAFGDGGWSTDQHPTHVYTDSDIYTVTLTVNGPNGGDIETKPGYISVGSGTMTFLPLAMR
jgi:PKD repeat protein